MVFRHPAPVFVNIVHVLKKRMYWPSFRNGWDRWYVVLYDDHFIFNSIGLNMTLSLCRLSLVQQTHLIRVAELNRPSVSYYIDGIDPTSPPSKGHHGLFMPMALLFCMAQESAWSLH